MVERWESVRQLFTFRIWICYLNFALRNVWKIIPSFRVSNRWNSNGPCFLTINTLKRWIPDFYLLIRCICRRRYAHCSNQNNSVQNVGPYRYLSSILSSFLSSPFFLIHSLPRNNNKEIIYHYICIGFLVGLFKVQIVHEIWIFTKFDKLLIIITFWTNLTIFLQCVKPFAWYNSAK